MTWVKICGITNLADARVAVDAGADALGFVFYEKSPRCVDVETVRKITAEVPPGVETVGVFVDQSSDQVREMVAQTGLTAAQVTIKTLVGLKDASDTAARQTPKMILSMSSKHLVDGEVFVGQDIASVLFALMIDSASDVQPGGTGRTFDWQRARPTIEELSQVCPTIVAGGLTPTNVTDAIRILHTWGVDVSSGVEARPGKKDPDKVRAFVDAVRLADRKH